MKQDNIKRSVGSTWAQLLIFCNCCLFNLFNDPLNLYMMNSCNPTQVSSQLNVKWLTGRAWNTQSINSFVRAVLTPTCHHCCTVRLPCFSINTAMHKAGTLGWVYTWPNNNASFPMDSIYQPVCHKLIIKKACLLVQNRNWTELFAPCSWTCWSLHLVSEQEEIKLLHRLTFGTEEEQTLHQLKE